MVFLLTFVRLRRRRCCVKKILRLEASPALVPAPDDADAKTGRGGTNFPTESYASIDDICGTRSFSESACCGRSSRIHRANTYPGRRYPASTRAQGCPWHCSDGNG